MSQKNLKKEKLPLPNLDLPFHGDAEQHDEIHYEDGPEHWHVKGVEECANHSDDDALRR